jgi:beta-glucosidase/6-phospho-beta-glucosidase/beta-galactosidase
MSRSHCGKSPWYTAADEEITESGCSYLDAPYDRDNGGIPDERRITFFREELAELARALADGARYKKSAWMKAGIEAVAQAIP